MHTLAHVHHGELEAKGSRFIATVTPISQFQRILAASRQAHPKATHHVTATRIAGVDGTRIEEQARDDGEPAGTAGRPALNVLRGHDLVDVGALVVRYFGGVKLGTGGLVRAYAGAVNAALAQATPCSWVRESDARLGAPFERTAELERDISEAGLTVVMRQFDAAGVLLDVRGPAAAVADLQGRYRPGER